MSDQAQLTCYLHTKTPFHTSTHSWGIGLSRILQYDWSRASWAITQDLEFSRNGIWDGKLNITIILLLTCFIANKMTKPSEKCPILTTFWSKYKQK